MTSAPAAASASAMPRPMPLVDPVTIALLHFRLISFPSFMSDGLALDGPATRPGRGSPHHVAQSRVRNTPPVALAVPFQRRLYSLYLPTFPPHPFTPTSPPAPPSFQTRVT